MKNKNKTVVVGLSGGVDSSVSALLLKEKGYRVIGMFMKNWEEKDAFGNCSAARDYEDVEKVCKLLDIDCYSVNFTASYREKVFQKFIDDLKNGLTPNPDTLCNKEIKFQVFLQKALALGADFLATGHYCQNEKQGDFFYLKKGVDPNKDQTYFLYAIEQKALQHTLFPIGHLHKSEVRDIAKKHNIPTAEKKDSTGICFIGKRNFKEFVSQYIPKRTGDFITPEGKVVGKHDGHYFYTIGQRRGLGIGGPGKPWFVVDKNAKENTVTVIQGDDHPILYATSCIATDASWISDVPKTPFKCHAKVRYRQKEEPCIIEKIENKTIYVSFPSPRKAVTPGQAIVFYNQDRCLGGGKIILRTLCNS